MEEKKCKKNWAILSRKNIYIKMKIKIFRSPSGASWDVLTNVRKKYPHIFYKAKEKIKVEMKFDDFVRNNLEIIKENKI